MTIHHCNDVTNNTRRNQKTTPAQHNTRKRAATKGRRGTGREGEARRQETPSIPPAQSRELLGISDLLNGAVAGGQRAGEGAPRTNAEKKGKERKNTKKEVMRASSGTTRITKPEKKEQNNTEKERKIKMEEKKAETTENEMLGGTKQMKEA